MKINNVWISKLTFNDGTTIPLEKNDIVVFVGPNNAGKSASLKESAALLRAKTNIGKVIKDITIEKDGTEDEFFDHIQSFSLINNGGNPHPHYEGFGYNIYEPQIKNLWENCKNGLSTLFPIFVNILSTEQRIQTANPAPNIKLTTQAKTNPIHFLQQDDLLEQKFSDYFKQAFGTNLIVHRNAGSEVPLYIGEKPILKNGQDRISSEYLRELEKLDLLNEQGDGMRSFVGVLLSAFISDYSILFIDEPEAFLHPPQAKLLGKMISKDLPKNKQVFLSTHSQDLLKGLLNSDISNLKIIRIQREENINKISYLNNTDISSVWADPLLRHSNILDGIFHTKVVLCESDSDCRFYSSLLEAIHDDESVILPDIMFIHCGGKQRMAMVIISLMKLNVPIRVISDFDLINNIKPLKDIFEALNGDWSSIEKEWRLVKSEVEKKKTELKKEEAKKSIDEYFNSVTGDILSNDDISTVTSILKKTSPWSIAKEVGRGFIPSGDASKSFDFIQSEFRKTGLHILEVGELEQFAKSIPNHGPKWVNAVLQKDLKSDTELEAARIFIKKVIS